MTYTDIPGAQRTRKEAYKHILKELRNDGLGAMINNACVYEVDGALGPIHCGIGCLFNKLQIADIKARGLNRVDIDSVADEISITNIEAVTGLCMDELVELQGEHDNSFYDSTTFAAKSVFGHFLSNKIKEAK